MSSSVTVSFPCCLASSSWISWRLRVRLSRCPSVSFGLFKSWGKAAVYRVSTALPVVRNTYWNFPSWTARWLFMSMTSCRYDDMMWRSLAWPIRLRRDRPLMLAVPIVLFCFSASSSSYVGSTSWSSMRSISNDVAIEGRMPRASTKISPSRFFSRFEVRGSGTGRCMSRSSNALS